MAKSYYLSGKKDLTIEAYKKATTIEPNYYLAWSNLGGMYGEFGLHENAIASFNTSFEINPKNVNGYINYIDYLFTLGRLDEIEINLEKLKKLSPKSNFAIEFFEILKKIFVGDDLINIDDSFSHLLKFTHDDSALKAWDFIDLKNSLDKENSKIETLKKDQIKNLINKIENWVIENKV